MAEEAWQKSTEVRDHRGIYLTYMCNHSLVGVDT